jgi:hypothetical protein
MNDPRTFVIGCVVILILLVALIVVGAVLLVPTIPEVSEQLPPGSSTLQVNLTTPLHGSKLLLDTPAAVYAEAVGAKPVVALELWVDGVSFGSHSPASGAAATWFSASWAWAPAGAGEHLLFARAMDENGQVVTSNVVRVTALPLEEYPLPVSEEAPDEMEPIPVSEPIPEEYEGLPPGATESTELPPAMIPPNDPSPDTPPPPAVPSGPTQPAPSIPPDKMGIWIRHVLGGTTAPPQAPDLAADVEGCTTRLFVTDHADNEEGFFIYRLGPGDTAFRRIATLDDYQESDPFVYVDADQYGKFLYYVAAFNAAGESPSPATQPLVIDAPQCLQPQHTGLGLADGKITTSTPVDKLYCYMSFNKGPWARIPPGTNTFIYPQNGEFDVGEYVELLTTPPPQTDVTLELECWGWQGGVLNELGRVSQTFGPSQFNSPIQMAGINYSLVGQLTATQLMSGTLTSPPVAHIARPIDVRLGTDPAVCASGDLGGMFSMLLCQGIVDAGEAILSWKWSPQAGCWPAAAGQPNPCPYNVEDIDGYRIYVHYPGQGPKRIDEVTNPEQTMRGIPPSGESPLVQAIRVALGATQPCYTVRAYKDGFGESEDSFGCVQAIRTEGRVSLKGQPAGWTALYGDDIREIIWTDAGNCPGGEPLEVYYDTTVDPKGPNRAPVAANELQYAAAGARHENPGYCYEAITYAWVTTIGFDLGQVSKPVTSATFYSNHVSHVCHNDGCTLGRHCSLSLMADGAQITLLPRIGGWACEEGTDVTAAVRAAQARGDPEVVLVIAGQPSVNGFYNQMAFYDNNRCYVEFDNFELDVTYTP